LDAIKEAPSTIISADADEAEDPEIRASASLTSTIDAVADDTTLTEAEETLFLNPDAAALDVAEIVEPTKEVLNPLAASWLEAEI